MCRDDEFRDNPEKPAYDVLKYLYYAGKNHFSHRYKGAENGIKSHHHEIGLKTISSYCNLVRASLGSSNNSDKPNHQKNYSGQTLPERGLTLLTCSSMKMSALHHQERHCTAFQLELQWLLLS